MKNKKGFEMSFAWMFALIVGAVILFIAIFFAFSLIRSGEKEMDVRTVQAIINSIEELQTTGQQGIVNQIELMSESRIYFRCEDFGDFGINRISLAQKSEFSGEWTQSSGFMPATNNQYIFAESEIQGKTIYTFTLPFDMPFKVADIIILHTEEYCFVNPPDEIRRTIYGLSQGAIRSFYIESDIQNCKNESKKVCFSRNSECDVIVTNFDCQEGLCSANVDGTPTIGNLIYARIFSSSDIFLCGQKRMMMRLEKLTEMYTQKSLMTVNNCPTTGLISYLDNLKEQAKENRAMGVLANARELDKQNRGLQCRLY